MNSRIKLFDVIKTFCTSAITKKVKLYLPLKQHKSDTNEEIRNEKNKANKVYAAIAGQSV